MEKLKIKGFNPALLKDLSRIGDIDYFEGPLLTLFEDSRSHLYLFDWVDRDNFTNRWLVYRISPKTLLDYMSGKISHLDLFNSNPDSKIYVTDIKSGSHFYNSDLHEIVDVPNEYYPNGNIFFEPSNCSNINKIKAFANRSVSRSKQDNEYLSVSTFTWDQNLIFAFEVTTRSNQIIGLGSKNNRMPKYEVATSISTHVNPYNDTKKHEIFNVGFQLTKRMNNLCSKI